MQYQTDNNKRWESYMPWIVWGLASAYFFFDYVARVSPGVMVPELQRAFSVSAAGLGGLSAFFYYPYLAMQVPVGLCVDRFSIRKLLTIMSIITGLGCILFGSAISIHTAQLGRFLIGFSAAFAFVSALKIAHIWFPPARLGLLAGLTQTLGMLGAAVGEAPVSYGVAILGWRESMFIMAVIFFILAVFIYKLVRDNPQQQLRNPQITQAPKSQHISIFISLLTVLRNPQTWWNALYAGLVFAPTAAFGELWGTSFMQFGRDFNPHVAAFANGLIFIGWGIGGPLSGWLTDRIGRRKPIMIFSAICGFICMGTLIYAPHLSPMAAYTLLFLYGMTNTGVAIAYAVAAEVNHRLVVGASLAFTNMMSVVIGALFQPFIGHLMDTRSVGEAVGVHVYNLADFQAALWLLPVCSALAIVCTLFIRETYCRAVSRPDINAVKGEAINA